MDPNLGREHEFHLISGISIFLTHLSQTIPESLRFPPLVPLMRSSFSTPVLCCNGVGVPSFVVPTGGVRGETVVNIVNPGDCLKESPIVTCLSVVLAWNYFSQPFHAYLSVLPHIHTRFLRGRIDLNHSFFALGFLLWHRAFRPVNSILFFIVNLRFESFKFVLNSIARFTKKVQTSVLSLSFCPPSPGLN